MIKLLVVLAMVATFLSPIVSTRVLADDPAIAGPDQPAELFDPSAGHQSILSLKFLLHESGDLELINHYFYNAIPASDISKSWTWATRLISFDNRCLKLSPLDDPRVIKLSRQGSISEQAARLGSPVELFVELVAEPDMHELEIIGSDDETLGKFDVAELFDVYCDGNVGDSLCIQRNKSLLVLDEPGGLGDYDQSVLEDFSSGAHMDLLSLDGGVTITSTKDERVVMIDLAQTSQFSHLFQTLYEPFETLTHHAVYNGQSVILDDGLSNGKDIDEAMRIAITGGARGISMTLGTITYDSVMNQSDRISHASKQFDSYDLQNDQEKIRVIGKSIAIDEEANSTALISVLDTAGGIIDRVEVELVPLPGFHTFVGLITPYNTIASVEIEYVNGVIEEAMKDLMVLPLDSNKLPSENFSRDYAPCSGEVGFSPSKVSDLPSILELSEREYFKIADDRREPISDSNSVSLMPSPPAVKSDASLDTSKSASLPRVVSKKESTAINDAPESDVSVPESKTENRGAITSCNAPSDDGYVAGNIGLLMFPLALYVYRRMPRK